MLPVCLRFYGCQHHVQQALSHDTFIGHRLVDVLEVIKGQSPRNAQRGFQPGDPSSPTEGPSNVGEVASSPTDGPTFIRNGDGGPISRPCATSAATASRRFMNFLGWEICCVSAMPTFLSKEISCARLRQLRQSIPFAHEFQGYIADRSSGRFHKVPSAVSSWRVSQTRFPPELYGVSSPILSPSPVK